MIHVVNLILYGGLVVGSLVAYPGLPDRIPAHFDANGQVTRWTDTTAVAWFTPVAVALGCALLLYAVPLAIRRWPHVVNIPRRDDFLRLPAERRAPIVRLIGQTLHVSAVPIGVLFGAIEYRLWRTALDGVPPGTGPGFFLLIFALGMMPAAFALGLLVRLNGALDRALRSD